VASLAAKGADKGEVQAGLGNVAFVAILIAVALAIFGATRWGGNSYAFFAAYVVVQYIVLGTA